MATGGSWRRSSRRRSSARRTGVGMRHTTLERLADGGIELARTIALQQLDQGHGDAAEVIAALGGADEQGSAGRRGLGEAISRPVAAGLTFPRDERLDMSLDLDLQAFVEAARMGGDDLQ